MLFHLIHAELIPNPIFLTCKLTNIWSSIFSDHLSDIFLSRTVHFAPLNSFRYQKWTLEILVHSFTSYFFNHFVHRLETQPRISSLTTNIHALSSSVNCPSDYYVGWINGKALLVFLLAISWLNLNFRQNLMYLISPTNYTRNISNLSRCISNQTSFKISFIDQTKTKEITSDYSSIW